MQSWPLLVAPPLGLAALVLRSMRRKSSRGKADEDGAREDGGLSFSCERVCTSDALLKRLGTLAKEPTPNTCVTVCGVSSADACTEACQRAVCLNTHQVPAWNDQCLRRCSLSCQKGSRFLAAPTSDAPGSGTGPRESEIIAAYERMLTARENAVSIGLSLLAEEEEEEEDEEEEDEEESDAEEDESEDGDGESDDDM